MIDRDINPSSNLVLDIGVQSSLGNGFGLVLIDLVIDMVQNSVFARHVPFIYIQAYQGHPRYRIGLVVRYLYAGRHCLDWARLNSGKRWSLDFGVEDRR